MKILIIPDSFKGSASNVVVANSIAEGVRKVLPDAECILRPLADGGEGSLETIRLSIGGDLVSVPTLDPLGKPITGHFLRVGKTAYVELANASGLHLLSGSELSARKTSTIGTGLVIKVALDETIEELVLCIGGSATNDGGAGMIQALGVHLLDKNEKEIGFGGGQLVKLNQIDISKIDERIKETKILVASDVQNPLCGPTGASRIYGPQKGATEGMIVTLDHALSHFADIIKLDLDKDIKDVPGAGAAGGLGAGLIAFLNAELKPGIDIVINTVQLEEMIQDADLVITGEGEINGSTIYGKTPIGVARVAKKYKIPVVSISALIDESGWVVKEHGIDYLIKPENPTMHLEFPKSRKIELLAKTISKFLKENSILTSRS